eukprot:1161587-Pelagomonas_calceolata.AAC.25
MRSASSCKLQLGKHACASASVCASTRKNAHFRQQLPCAVLPAASYNWVNMLARLQASVLSLGKMLTSVNSSHAQYFQMDSCTPSPLT